MKLAAPAAPAFVADAALTQRLDAVIARTLAEQRLVGTVVLVAQHGQSLYRREAGRPMREDAIFLLASVTKPIVTAALLRLVEQDRVALTDPVTRWLPGFRPRLADGSTPTITLHQLLTHSAGLTYDFMEPADSPYHAQGISNGLDAPGISLDENLRRIAEATLNFAPGQGWGYSMAIDVLGAVIAAVTGQSLPAAVAELVTGPLAMCDTAFAVVDPARLAVPYGDTEPVPQRMNSEQTVYYAGAPVRFAPGRLFDPQAFPSGGGGMAGTAGDVLTLLEAIRCGDTPVLGPTSVERVFQPHIGAAAETQGPGWGFGYGGAYLVDPLAAQSPQHVGTLQWGGAYGHHWFVDSTAGLSVVALTNTAFEGMAGQFTVELRDAVYGPAAD
jgi:CubicO group peptidase (beta-lactamase class C family)